jgi:hypothetical protein
MKVYVDEIEEYPVLKVRHEPSPLMHEIDLSPDELDDLRRVEAEYDAWQNRLLTKKREKKQ